MGLHGERFDGWCGGRLRNRVASFSSWTGALRWAAHASSASRAGRIACPQCVRPYSTLGGTWGCTIRRTTPSSSICRSCCINIFCETAGIARSKSENRSNLPPNKWNRITSFHRPSRILSARSMPSSAEVGVNLLTLPFGGYLTFLCVLVIG